MERVKTRHAGFGVKFYAVPDIQKAFIRGVLGLFDTDSQTEHGNMVINIIDNLCDIENSRLSNLENDGYDCFEEYTAYIGLRSGDWIKEKLLLVKAACIESEFYEMAANITAFVDMSEKYFKSLPSYTDIF